MDDLLISVVNWELIRRRIGYLGLDVWIVGGVIGYVNEVKVIDRNMWMKRDLWEMVMIGSFDVMEVFVEVYCWMMEMCWKWIAWIDWVYVDMDVSLLWGVSMVWRDGWYVIDSDHSVNVVNSDSDSFDDD